jgi:thymidylate synthase (FAD)
MSVPVKVMFYPPPAAKVQLVALTDDPEKVLASTSAIYHGHAGVVDRLTAEAEHELEVSMLQTPYEMIHHLWLIKDVTRAFTHQLVRYRVGVSYAQESMRFVDCRNAAVLLPDGVAVNPEALDMYIRATHEAFAKYGAMLDAGVDPQDARGVLPTNILTHIYFDCNHKTLMHIYKQRMSGLAQPGEWEYVLGAMKKILAARNPLLARTLVTMEESKRLEEERASWVKTTVANLHPLQRTGD